MFDLEKGLRNIFNEIQKTVPSDNSGKEADAYTVVRILANGNRPARTLKTLLKNTDMVFLANTADALSLDIGGNPTRAELEASIYRAFMEHKIAKSVFNHSQGELIELIVDIHDKGDFIVPDNYQMLDLAPGLMAYHIISAWIDKGENLILRLPKEIAQQFEEHMLDMKSVLDDMFADIDEAAVAAVELYGVIPFNDFIGLLHKYGISELPDDIVRIGLDHITAQEDEECGVYKLDGEYLVHAWLTDDEAALLAECEERSRLIPRKVFPKAAFLKFSDPAYTDLPRPWVRLREYMEMSFPEICTTRFDFESMFVDLRGVMKLHYPLEEFLELFYEIGVVFKDLDQEDELIEFIQDVHNSTRIWGNCGFTPAEMFTENAEAMLRAMEMQG